jgi:hypothetical protein
MAIAEDYTCLPAEGKTTTETDDIRYTEIDDKRKEAGGKRAVRDREGVLEHDGKRSACPTIGVMPSPQALSFAIGGITRMCTHFSQLWTKPSNLIVTIAF